MAGTSKNSLKACITDPKAVSALLGHAPSESVLLARAYALARKHGEAIEDADALYAWLYWCGSNAMEKQADALFAMGNAILELPESAPGGKAAAGTGSLSVAFRALEHAEFTFTPTPEFRRACGCEHGDVGIFCDAGESLLLEQVGRSRKGGRLRVRIAEGTCEILANQWEEIPVGEVPRSGRAGRRGSVFDISRIRDEFVG